MFGNLGKLAGVMKNAGKIQEMMKEAQDELSKIIVSGEAGAGAVKIQMTGKNQVLSVHFDDEILKESKEVLQDLTAAAINDALKKAAEETQSRMVGLSNLVGGDLGNFADLLGTK
jgi:DNA-binding YbaB/EbfC family protein